MKSSNLRGGRGQCSREILLAAAASACLLSSVSMAAIVTSPVSNVPVPNNFSGLYINIVNGATGTSAGAVPGFDFNPYSSGGLSIYWGTVAPPAPAPTRGGGVAATSTGPLLVLAPGDSVGPASAISARVVRA